MLPPRSFDEFMRVPVRFYKTIGEELYEQGSRRQLRSLAYKTLFYAGLLNFNLLVAGEMVYFTKALQSYDTLLLATAVAPCIGFSLVADFKQAALALHKRTLRLHLASMEQLFPRSAQQQRAYALPLHERTMRRVMVVFSLLCLAYTSTFSIYPACKSALLYYFLGAAEFQRSFGFLIWYPYDNVSNALCYWLTYGSQVWGAYFAGVAFLSADLVLIASITQLCMHFNNISKRLEGTAGDGKQLQQLVQLHAKCLEQSELVNQIFSFSILLNFLTASLTICFIGFQVTASSTEDIVKYAIFLMASLVQVFIVCYYGDELMTASSRVGDAAYNQQWYNYDERYKRMLSYIILRSQRPASIRAPTLPPISFNTYMNVISMSYQFFALLRTTYYGN